MMKLERCNKFNSLHVIVYLFCMKVLLIFNQSRYGLTLIPFWIIISWKKNLYAKDWAELIKIISNNIIIIKFDFNQEWNGVEKTLSS